jgi:hypothetical protein
LYDGFIFKLGANGRSILYSAYFGSNDLDVGNDVAVDENSNAYVVGTSFASSFPTTVGVFQETFAGGISDAFVAKITDDEGTTGTGGRVRAPRRVNFGRISMGATITKTFVVRNAGRQKLTGTINSVAAPYLIVEGGGPFALNRGQSVEVTVRFKPDQLGRTQRLLSISSTDNRRPTVNVTCDGRGRP